MNNRRDTFAKRQREAELKERARAKLARRLAKRNEPRTTKGPEIGELGELGPDGLPIITQDGSVQAASPVTPGADPANSSD